MDAFDLLEKFIDSRSGVDEIIATHQLKKWLPKRTDEASLQMLSDLLKQERRELVNNIKQDIEHEFHIPLQNIIASRQKNELEELKNLVGTLSELTSVSQAQEKMLDDEIEKNTGDIKILSKVIEGLADKSEKMKDISDDSLIESVEKLNQLVPEQKK